MYSNTGTFQRRASLRHLNSAGYMFHFIAMLETIHMILLFDNSSFDKASKKTFLLYIFLPITL